MLGGEPPQGPVALFGPEARVDPGFVGPDAVHVTTLRPDWDRVSAAGGKVALRAPDGLSLAIVSVPKSRAQGLGWVATALTALAPGGRLVIDGQKAVGVDTLLKQVRAALPLEGPLAKRHGKIAWCTRPKELPAEVAAWAEAVEPCRNPDGFLTAPGMFSADGIDAGTRVLMAHLPADAEGAAADFGAGWGALSDALLKAAPGIERLDLVEADRAALDAAEANIDDPRARYHWADIARWEGGPYRLIVANPPFHAGRTADPDLGRAFIATAARTLHPKGVFLLVANRQLPYEHALDSGFHVRETRAEGSGYKVIAASRPRRGRAAA